MGTLTYLAWELWLGNFGLGILAQGSQAWGIQGKSGRGNRLAGHGGIGRGGPKPLPFKNLSENPSRQA